MITKGKLYKVVAVLVSLGLLFQVFAVRGMWLSNGVAAAEGAAESDDGRFELPPELEQELAGLGVVTAEGQPGRFLMDGAAVQANDFPTEPAALANPLSISRVQSTYQAGGTAVVTYTVTNNRLPSYFPTIPEGATVTETAQIMADFDMTLDPQTIRNVTVASTLNGTAAYLNAQPLPDRQGQTFVWNLGDIPPQAGRSFSLELQLPGAAADFLELDNGAAAYGTLQGRMVSAQAAPAVLAPDGLAQWLVWTPDADIYDEYMLEKAAELEQNPAALFDYVRSLGYELYSGSMRGTRGTLWSEAGNSADQASLLIAMLRSGGIPARYRHGSLATADRQQLIASMFPTPNQVIGHIPANATVADPVNDPELLAEAADHWWVEAYLPGMGWTNLDPAFPTAEIGDIFATPAGDGTDRIAELPDSTRHKVHLTLKVEQYNDFPVSGSNLSVIYPLTATLNVVELVGRPANLGFLVNTDTAGGVYVNVTHTYNPFISFGREENIWGEAFSDFLTNFPLASHFTTAMWVTVETETPNGEVTAYEREIKDRIGVEGRVNGGIIDLEPIDDTSFISTADVVQLQVVPQSKMPRAEVGRALAGVMAVTSDTGAALVTYDALDLDDSTAVTAWIEAHSDSLQAAQLAMMDMLGTTFYALSTAADRQPAPASMLVKSYPDSPKLLLMSQSAITETVNFSFELLNIHERSLAYPGQAEEATVAANLARTLGDKAIEYDLLNQLNSGQTGSAYETVLAAINGDIPLALISAANLGDLASLPISEEAKARITLAVQQGLVVFVPAEPVNVDGELTIGWVEIDETGHASFVNEQGRRASTAFEFALQLVVMYFATGHGAALLTGLILTVILFIAAVLGLSLDLTDYALGEAMSGCCGKFPLDLALALEGAAHTAAEACAAGAGPFAADCFGGVVIAVLFIAPMILLYVVTDDPSLPGMLGDRQTVAAARHFASRPITLTATTAATNLVVSAESEHAALMGQAAFNWADANQHGLLLSTLTAGNADLYEGGVLLASGSLEMAGLTAASLTGNPAVIALDAAGSHAFFAPAVNGLGLGTGWSGYTAALSAAQPYTLTLAAATVTMNDSAVYSGTLTAVVSGAAQIGGPEHSPVPQFNSGTAVQVQAAAINIGPLAGSVLAGGTPFPAENGLALAPFSGPVTVSESGATADLIEFSGTADFFSLSLNPASSSTDPTQPVMIIPELAANFDDTYTLTVEAPVGWTVSVAGSGQITALPPAGAAPADYTLLVTAQSGQYPDLFATAVHTVTVVSHEGMALAVVEDPLITIPMGPVDDPLVSVSGSLGHIVNGRAEIPGAAYTILITNTSTTGYTFDITVSGLPGGWAILSNAGQATATTLALGAGEMGQVGLYISPTVSALMAPGTNYTIDVNAAAQGNPGLSQNDSILFTMPGLAFPYPQLAPKHQYVTAGDALTFDFTATNVGNVTGSFPVTATVRASAFTGVVLEPSPITSGATWTTPPLAPGELDGETITIDTATLTAGKSYFLVVESAQGEYRPAAYVAFTVVGPTAGPIFETADEAAEVCTIGEPGLSAALQELALRINELEASCQAGDCSLSSRDEVVEALDSVVFYADVSPLVTADGDLAAVAADMATHTTDAEIEADMAAISAAVAGLEMEVCELSQHDPAVKWQPVYHAGLVGQPVSYTLEVTNQGTVTTTYAVTVELPSGTTTFSTNLAPDQTDSSVHAANGGALGLYDLTAAARATGLDVLLPGLLDEAEAALNVVDRFIQLTAVTADPPFVETGSSSTNLSIEVSNIANIAWEATAETRILAPGGGISYTADIPLTIVIGSPRTYELAGVNTSGWAEGVYTVTVDLMDASGSPIGEGSGYGYLGVGQALGVSHSVEPAPAGPGTVTVTTVITTEILADTVISPAVSPLVAWPERPLLSGESSEAGDLLPPNENDGGPDTIPGDGRGGTAVPANRPSLLTTWAITRTEDTSPTVTYSGAWTPINNLSSFHASRSTYTWSNSAGSAASFAFNGSWIGVGLATGTQNGYAELFVDGVSQGIVDLYSRNNDVKRVTMDGLADMGHVISVTVTGLKNPLSTNDWVAVDYFDTWDGTTMPDGTYEQSDGRVWLSHSWVNQNDANAGGGSYYRNGHTAWFPFTGDSISFQAVATPNAEKLALYLDDEFQGYYDIFGFTVQTRTFHFDGLGAGPHVLTVRAFRGQATIDSFTTPATGPGTPPVIGSFHRYEEHDPAVLYNGFPYTQTATSWASAVNDAVSDHYAYYSGNAGNSAVFNFSGTAVGVGLYAERSGGLAEIFLDGISQGVYDTYRRDPGVMAFYFRDLSYSSHTISVTVLGQKNPLATNDLVYVDYFDVWDGTPLPDGTFEELDGRVYRSYRWELEAAPQASDGQYLQDGNTGAAHVWFPFTGDSVTFRAMAYNQGSQWTKVSIDGQPVGEINLYNNTVVSRTFSFGNLGAGLHVLQLERYRGELMVDAFTTPGTPPFFQTPVYTGVVRYEEDDPALLYNGVSHSQRPQSWSSEFIFANSGSYSELATTPGNTVSLEFYGRWASVGFLTSQYGGQAEIFVDGVSRGTVGLYSPTNDVESFTVGGLVTGTHTLSVTVLGIPDPPSPQSRVYLDYIDVWDGQGMADGTANATKAQHDGRIHFSALIHNAANANAINGDYMVNSAGNPEANVWYGFTGDSFTFYGFSLGSGTSLVDVYVDNQFIETVSLVYPFSGQPLAFHYGGLGEGAHVARISSNVGIRVDAFASNQPPVGYQPLAEWWESDRTAGGSIFGGLHVPVTVGDVTGDGRVELAFASSNWDHQGELFLMNGDGSDAGGGDPIIWSVPFDIFNGFEDVGAPAIAELDGQPGAEIVMSTVEGVYAFHSDGSTYWFTDTLKPHVFFGTPAIGNLDLDAEPEIVINLNQNLAVFEQDGAPAWTFNDPDGLTMPLLADLTGDGLLDILVHDWNDTLYLYDYNLGSPQLVWSAVFTNALHGYGAPAVADLDQDGEPEIAIASETRLFALNAADGSPQWSAPLGAGSTGGVTIADIDGDGAVELVTGSLFNGGTLYAFEADGTQKWAVPALDSSPLNTSAADLDHDGAAELLWNGANQGFTIYDGRTGAILFNEPLVVSVTGSDVPVAADVDQDGYTEVVVPAQTGIRVFGFDGVWGPTRPLWNQLNYHVTNINDDMTIPFGEVNSWDTHNSYRAQWAAEVALPVYDVTLTHTVGITGVAVVSGSFSVPPTVTADPLYGWDYVQSYTNAAVTRTFESVLSGLQPGETRLAAQGTEVAYELPSGTNHLTLPPLYVSVPHIIAVEPLSLTVGAGGTAVFEVVLDNPAAAAESYTLTVAGLPTEWAALPATVPVSAGAQVTVPLTVQVPADVVPGGLSFTVFAANSSGGEDQAGAELMVVDGLDVALEPESQSAAVGTAVTYTLVLTNHLETAETYTLTAEGAAVAGANVSLPPTVTVSAGSSESLPVTVTAAADGFYPFTIQAESGLAADGDSAVLEATGSWAVEVALAPASAVGGPLTPAVFTVTVTNRGNLADSYDLDAALPAGWTHQFKVNGVEIESLSLVPELFNAAEVLLLVTPPVGEAPGSYDVAVSAQSQSNSGVSDTADGTVQVETRGVDVSITPASTTMLPTDSGLWQVTITNTGTVADSYWLTMTGFIGPFGDFSANPVALNAGQSATVQLTADGLDLMLPATYPFGVGAASQNNALIRNEAAAEVTFESLEAVAVGWVPAGQTVTDTLTAEFMMVITNSGNVATTYDLGLNLPAGVVAQMGIEQLWLPAHVATHVLVSVEAEGPGVYLIEGTADSTTSAANGSSTATLEVVFTNLPPSADAGGDQTADEGQTVNFNGTANDPEGQPLEIRWDFGDGTTTNGTLTPSHVYDDDGQFTVTLVVTDVTGLSDSDTLLVTVDNVAPMVEAGADQTAEVGDTVSLDPATFSDPGAADTHTATINWGDGTIEAGTVDQANDTVSGSHVYSQAGVYTVTVTVVDDDGGEDSDSFTVTIAGADTYYLYMPAVFKPN